MKRLKEYVFADGQSWGPADIVPAATAEKIRDDAWETVEVDDDRPDRPAPAEQSAADTSDQGDQGGAGSADPATAVPASPASTGVGDLRPAVGTPPPRAGKGSSAAKWAEFAEANGIQVAEDAKQHDIIAAVEAEVALPSHE